MAPFLLRAKSKAQRLFGVPGRDSGSATSPIRSYMSAQSVPEPSQPPPLGVSSPPATEPEPSPLSSLQEKIWNQAYDDARTIEPKLVERFEKLVFAELHRNEISAEFVDRTEIGSHQMREFVQDGLDRTKKEASFKQGIDDGLEVVRAVRGIMDRAVQVAPEAAVVWAAVCLGIEVCDSTLRAKEDSWHTVLG